MLRIDELFNTKPAGDKHYSMDEPTVTGSYQTYKIGTDSHEYQAKFDNLATYGKNVQVVRIGEVSPDQKKFKPLIQRIDKPLEFFGALREILYEHAFGSNVMTKKKNGWIVVIQQDKFSIKMSSLKAIVTKLLRPDFEVVQNVVIPTAEQLNGKFPKDGDFDVIVIKRKAASTANVFNSYLGQVLTGEKIDIKMSAGTSVNAPEPTKKVAYQANQPLGKQVSYEIIDALYGFTGAPITGNTDDMVDAAGAGDTEEFDNLYNKWGHSFYGATADFYHILNYEMNMVIGDGQGALISNWIQYLKNKEAGSKLKGVFKILPDEEPPKAKAAPKPVAKALTKEEVDKIAASIWPKDPGFVPKNPHAAKAKTAALAGNYKAMIKALDDVNKPTNQKKFPKTALFISKLALAMGSNIPAPVTPPVAKPPEVKAPVKAEFQYFFVPGFKTAQNFMFIGLTGKVYDANGFHLADADPLKFLADAHFFMSQSDFSSAEKWMQSQEWYKGLRVAVKAKVQKSLGGAIHDIQGWSVPKGLPKKDLIVQEFKNAIEESIVLELSGLNTGLDGIYKFYAANDTEYIVNAGTKTATKTTPTETTPVVAKKAPKGMANGLRGKTGMPLSAETVKWLSENPPADKGERTPIEWKTYKSIFSTLDELDIEVGGFAIKFSTDTPEKLFKQLSNIETVLGAGSAEFSAAKNKVEAALLYDKYSIKAQLSEAQNAYFPENSEIAGYTGSAYSAMNGYLRGNKVDWTKTPQFIKGADDYFKQYGRPMPKSLVVFRGQSILDSELRGLMEGKEYVMHGYVSTSMSMMVANGFLKNESINAAHVTSSASVIQTIKSVDDLIKLSDVGAVTDDGRKLSCMLVITGLDKTLSVIPGDWGGHQDECEIVVNRGTRMKIDPDIPIKLVGYKSSPTLLIYCTITGDGAITYEVNEMTQRNQPKEQERKTFSKQHAKNELKDKTEKALVLNKFVSDGKVEPEKVHPKWSDDIFS